MRFFWVLIGAFVLIILLAVVFLNINRPKSNNAIKTNNKAVVLADSANSDAVVSYTVEGVTNSNEAHRLIKISVSKSSRNTEVIAGYQGNVIKSQTLGNNVDAYRAFLAALQTVGFTDQKANPIVKDVQGQCPFGLKYYFNTTGINNAANFLWSVSCSKLVGTFNGDQGGVQRLFQSQIPNYSSFVSGVSL
jgi:hypothetical protein